MKIYVAGKWEEKKRVREVQQQLRDAGHTITYDWTLAELNGVPSVDQALNDKQGVLGADAFVGVFEKDLAYKGAMTELGMALAKGIPCYILGKACDNNIFITLPEIKRGLEGLLNGNSAVSN